MPRSATRGGVLSNSDGRALAPEDMGHPPGSFEAPAAEGRPPPGGYGPGRWPVVALAALGSAACVAAAGCFCALVYPILKELREGRVRGEDGAEERILGFWSILVLSVLAGCICCVCSWTLTCLDSYQPGSGFPTPLALVQFRDASDQGFHMSHGVVVLNGIMAMLTVVWSLT